MKKLFALMMSLMMILAAGCGAAPASSAAPAPESSSSQSSQDVSASQAAGEKIKIGLVQFMEHTSLDQIREACLAQLEARGYDSSKVEIDYQNGSGDRSNLTSISQKFVGDGCDLIIAIATPAAQAAAAVTSDIPIVFAAVTDPVGAGLVSDPAKPDRNLTGTSDAIPVDAIFQLAARMTPDAKTFGFLYNSGEDNSLSVIQEAKAYCDQNGISYTEATVTNTSEVQQSALQLLSKADAIYVPIDNTVASAMATLGSLCVESKKPCYVSADSMVLDGGLASVGVNYDDLGSQTGDMAADILEGAAVSDVPVCTLEQFNEVVNDEVAAALGIQK